MSETHSMTLLERLTQLSEKARRVMDQLETEEATKNALVMPFIAALGYDVFSPDEVIPEYTADVGTKKGEKVDYALRRGGEITVLIEAKAARAELGASQANQLFRYFTVTKARIALLTNGHQYWFYSDLEKPNIMDDSPFLELDLLQLHEHAVTEVARLSRDAFDLDTMIGSAMELRTLRGIRRTFDQQFDAPDDDFVRFFFERSPSRYERFGTSAKEFYVKLVRKALHQVVHDRVQERLRAALAATPPEHSGQVPAATTDSTEQELPKDSDVVTTQDEVDGYRIVKAIVCNVVPTSKISLRDAKSYCSVLFDDSNRKPICRLHFNRAQYYLGLFDEQKNETRHAIGQLDDIYTHAELLRATASRYLAEK